MWDQVLLLLLHQLLTPPLTMLMAALLLPNNNHILRWQHRFQARPTIMVFMLMKLTVQLPILVPQQQRQHQLRRQIHFYFGNVNYVLLGKERDILCNGARSSKTITRREKTFILNRKGKCLAFTKETFFHFSSFCLHTFLAHGVEPNLSIIKFFIICHMWNQLTKLSAHFVSGRMWRHH